jgi:hypothetical protein
MCSYQGKRSSEKERFWWRDWCWRDLTELEAVNIQASRGVISISKALPIECRSPVTENFIWQLMKMGEQIDEVIFYQSLCARWNERLSSMGHCF